MQESALPDMPAGQLKFGSKRDVAAMFGCCTRTVDNLMAKGCPHIKIGHRHVRFDLRAVHQWVTRTYGRQRLGREHEAESARTMPKQANGSSLT